MKSIVAVVATDFETKYRMRLHGKITATGMIDEGTARMNVEVE